MLCMCRALQMRGCTRGLRHHRRPPTLTLPLDMRTAARDTTRLGENIDLIFRSTRTENFAGRAFSAPSRDPENRKPVLLEATTGCRGVT
jgi:hypothetical protein